MLDQHLRRLLALLAFGLVLGLLVATQKVYFERGVVPGDAFTYLAAGERLNAGHPLYALSPGDRPVELNPPQWTIPLVSPPPIAVLWRPLAALPSELGVYLWWAAQLAALAASLVMLARRRPFTTAGAMLVLLFPTVYEIGVGNVNSFLLLGLILTWRAARDGREAAAGAIPALMTAVKLTPVVLGWWLLVTGHRGAVVAALVTGAAIVAVSLVGAGIDTHVEYLRILADRSAIGSSPLSMAGMARYVGVPDAIASLLPTACALLGAIAVFVLRRRPALSFVAAVLAMLYGSPAVSINWYILLYALIAPLAWPMRAGEPSPQPFPATGGTANTQPSAPA